MKALVVGGGGREHVLCWFLSRSASVFCAPGNPGTAGCATNFPIAASDHRGILDAIRSHKIDLTVVGPEAPLAAGLVDELESAGCAVFGPSAAAAQIEASKAFAKEIMQAARVETARAEVFTDMSSARAYIDRHAEPLVVKASGLAAGKGAIVCTSREEAIRAAEAMFAGRFGSAGSIVLVEDFMLGEEVSVFAVTDGEQVVLLPPSQDHKRLLEHDEGPNTGGMGAYSPVSMATPALLDRVEHEILLPTLRELQRRRCPYRGFLYAGLMITPNGDPSVVEFNCRMGDPEAQVVFPVLEGDELVHDMFSVARNDAWTPKTTRLRAARTAVTTVLASAGYPDAPEKGKSIELPEHLPSDTLLFHAGTRDDGGVLTTAGGRVLCSTGVGADVAAAADASRELAELVQFEGKAFRRDIGWREVARAGAA